MRILTEARSPRYIEQNHIIRISEVCDFQSLTILVEVKARNVSLNLDQSKQELHTAYKKKRGITDLLVLDHVYPERTHEFPGSP